VAVLAGAPLVATGSAAADPVAPGAFTYAEVNTLLPSMDTFDVTVEYTAGAGTAPAAADVSAYTSSTSCSAAGCDYHRWETVTADDPSLGQGSVFPPIDPGQVTITNGGHAVRLAVTTVRVRDHHCQTFAGYTCEDTFSNTTIAGSWQAVGGPLARSVNSVTYPPKPSLCPSADRIADVFYSSTGTGSFLGTTASVAPRVPGDLSAAIYRYIYRGTAALC
jgi:hypothetical protein